MKIAIITGTVRKSRKSIHIANYIKSLANERSDKEVEFEIVDIKDFDLPLFDEANPPAAGLERESQKSKDWVSKLASFDAYIVLTAEYNHSVPGALKNAIDYIGREVTNKTGAIISYGHSGGQSAADSLTLILSSLGMQLVRTKPSFTNAIDFDLENNFVPGDKATADAQIISMISHIINHIKMLSNN